MDMKLKRARHEVLVEEEIRINSLEKEVDGETWKSMCEKQVRLIAVTLVGPDKKEYCEVEIDKIEDNKKVLQNKISVMETAFADAKESITTLKIEMEAAIV